MLFFRIDEQLHWHNAVVLCKDALGLAIVSLTYPQGMEEKERYAKAGMNRARTEGPEMAAS